MKLLKTGKKGFTLVELLVVVVIIALIVSIAFTYLVNAQKRSRDAGITADMDGIRKTANLVFNQDGDYDCVCVTPPAGCSTCNEQVVKAAADIDKLNGTLPALAIYRNLTSNATSFCAEVQLNLGSWYCVDSNLKSKTYTSPPVCSSSFFACE